MNKLIKDFIYYLEFKENKKYNTIISIKNDVEQFQRYFFDKGIGDIKKIDFLMLREYFNFLKSSEISNSTFNRKLSSLKKFYKYLKEKDFIQDNIILPLENLQNKEKEIEYLNDEEIEKFRIAITGNNFNSSRDRLIFELILSSGLTTGELLTLGEKNFILDEREIQFFKGKKRRFSFFSKRAKKAYEEFIEIKKSKFKEENNIDILFVNNSNERLTDRSLRRIITKYKEKAEIKKEISSYTLRHTFCIIMLRNGMPKEYLRKLLDISNIEQLAGYERIVRKESL